MYKKTRNQHLRADVNGRSYKNYNKDELVQNINDNVPIEALESLHPEEAIEYITGSVKAYLDEKCPIKAMKIPTEEEPWFDEEVRKDIAVG